MRALATRVDVAGLHARRHFNAPLQKAAQDTVDGASHGNAGHGRGNLAGAHDVTNLKDRLKDAVYGSAQNAVRGVTGDDARNTVLGAAGPSQMTWPRKCPRLVSTTASQSLPA